MNPKIQIDTYYELTPPQLELADRVGTARYNNARAHGVYNAKIGDQSNKQTDVDGMGAELAFCHMFGTEPDLSLTVRSAANGSDPLDTIIHYITSPTLPKGIPVDVKHTCWPNGCLLVRGNKLPGDYLFCLMNGFFRFKGFAWASELFIEEYLKNGSYWMPQQNLRTLEEVIADPRYNACLLEGNFRKYLEDGK